MLTEINIINIVILIKNKALINRNIYVYCNGCTSNLYLPCNYRVNNYDMHCNVLNRYFNCEYMKIKLRLAFSFFN